MLNASAEMSCVMPRAERLSFHHCGSAELSIAATIPTTRKTASTSESCRGEIADALIDET